MESLANAPVLHHGNTDPVMVHPPNDDIFYLPAAAAAAACQQQVDLQGIIQSFHEAFVSVRKHVCDWANGREVCRVYIAARGPAPLLVLIMTPGDEHAFDLDEDISQLDLELSQRWGMIPFDVMAIPDGVPGGLASFAPEKVQIVYDREKQSGH